jgi:hypothetical protein
MEKLSYQALSVWQKATELTAVIYKMPASLFKKLKTID